MSRRRPAGRSGHRRHVLRAVASGLAYRVAAWAAPPAAAYSPVADNPARPTSQVRPLDADPHRLRYDAMQHLAHLMRLSGFPFGAPPPPRPPTLTMIEGGKR